MKKILPFMLLSLFVSDLFAAEGWSSEAYKISVIDSVAAENYAYLTLENYTNPNCSNNRIALKNTSKSKFDQMFSMVLSAFHAGSKVRFYFPDTSNCDSTRIMLVK